MLIQEYSTYKIWESEQRISQLRMAKETGVGNGTLKNRSVGRLAKLVALLAAVIIN